MKLTKTDGLLVKIAMLKNRAGEQGRYQTMRGLDLALKIAGWELAGKLGDEEAGKALERINAKIEDLF